MVVLIAFHAAGADVEVNTHFAKVVLISTAEVFETFAAVEVG